MKRNLLTSTAIALTVTLSQSPALAQQISATGDVTPIYPGGNPWNVGSDLIVGNTSEGSLTIQNGGSVTSPSYLYLGNQANGHITVDNGTLTSERLLLGNAAGVQGTLLITNGGIVNTTGAVGNAGGIAQVAGSSGTVTLSNNSIWNTAGSIGLGMGDGATGFLNVMSGSTVNIAGAPGVGGLFVGNIGSTSQGFVLIDGPGSAINVEAGIYVGGTAGAGSVTVRNGGLLHSDFSIHAGGDTWTATTATGTITVTGAGSAMTASQDINIGMMGGGTLNVLDQAMVSAGGHFGIGSLSTGVGNVLVSGAGSSVTAAALTVGDAGTGTLTLANQATFNATGGTTIAAQAGSTGTLNIGAAAGAGPVAPGQLNSPTLAFGAGTGGLVFNHTDTSGNYAFGAAISGTGAVDVHSGFTRMTGSSTYSGPTSIFGGTLAAGAANVFSPNSNYTVQAGGTLDLSGHDQTLVSLTNAGAVSLGMAGGPAGTTLNTGSYVGQGGTLFLNTFLNAGGPLANQVTDRLLVAGDASGSTNVSVRSSGSGAYTSVDLPTNNTGISIIQVAGASSAGAFSLAGGYATVSGSPFQYHLNAYGPGSAFGAADPGQNLVGNPNGYWDFRLQNVYVTPVGEVPPGTTVPPPDARLAVAPQVPSYITLSTALFNAGQMDIDQLHRRLGEIRDAQIKGLPKQGEVFVRAYGYSMDYTSSRSFTNYGFDSTQDYAALQLGGSAVALDDTRGTLRVGLAGSYGKLQFEPDAIDGWSKGDFDNGKISAIATFQAREGWYIDAIVFGGWFDGHAETAMRGRVGKLSGTSIGASLEAGYPIALGWQNLVVEPQVQVSWQHLMFNSSTDMDNIRVRLGDHDQGLLRVGGRLLRAFETDDGRFVTPYLKVNLLQGFAENGSVDLSGVRFGTGRYGTAVQVGGGITGMLSDRLAIFGDAAWQHQLTDGGFDGWALNGGVRYSF